jgi:hypothetical protein
MVRQINNKELNLVFVIFTSLDCDPSKLTGISFFVSNGNSVYFNIIFASRIGDTDV